VIKGIATVEVDGVKRDLTVNESIFIPLGAVHRLSNHTNEPVEIIEVQNGSYLGEDDIVRLEDDYKRG
jgi:mannose-6-phosphate isomerase-like protein (cupin superfamily)